MFSNPPLALPAFPPAAASTSASTPANATVSASPPAPSPASAPRASPSVTSGSPYPPASPAQIHFTEFLHIHKPKDTPASAPYVDDTGAPTAFPHTVHLLTCILSALLADQTHYVLKMYDTVVMLVWSDLLGKSNDADRPKLEMVLDSGLRMTEFFDREGGFPIGISSLIEQPSSEQIIWGITNDQISLKEDLGWLLPVFNAKLCGEYEQTFQEPAVSSEIHGAQDPNPDSATTASDPDQLRIRRAQLGSLIAITFIHEGMHTYLRWRLGTCIDPAAFNTPELTAGRKGESGWELEQILFKGSVLAQLCAGDVKRADRFQRIENIWIQDPHTAATMDPVTKVITPAPSPPLRMIPTSRLQFFHQRLLQSVLTVSSIVVCFFTRDTPLRPQAVVQQNNRVLLRLSPSSASDPDIQMVQTMPPLSHCGLALKRADGGPDVGRFVRFR
ncbi:hypothetical protein C8F04DRAFT_1097534 [Mycena alexandri]|uniref:Uncharacterized protein n=1 Tax=Mycena alexandri TaxID=1745969 RepID=A0AAD6T1A9_9AGAR|nr:hypothetical protein C8F04DRAFT_1097534 [Mycena alexandri]